MQIEGNKGIDEGTYKFGSLESRRIPGLLIRKPLAFLQQGLRDLWQVLRAVST
jgi:hypothetical protein